MNSEDYLRCIVEGLVENIDDIEIERRVDSMGVLLTLKVNNADVGRVIGKGGTIAKAVRSLMSAYGVRVKERIHVKIHDPQNRFPRD